MRAIVLVGRSESVSKRFEDNARRRVRLTVYSQLPCSPPFRGHSSSLLVIGVVSVGSLNEIHGDYIQKRTFARRERERAMAGATPRSARQGIILFRDPGLSAMDMTR